MEEIAPITDGDQYPGAPTRPTFPAGDAIASQPDEGHPIPAEQPTSVSRPGTEERQETATIAEPTTQPKGRGWMLPLGGNFIFVLATMIGFSARGGDTESDTATSTTLRQTRLDGTFTLMSDDLIQSPRLRSNREPCRCPHGRRPRPRHDEEEGIGK